MKPSVSQIRKYAFDTEFAADGAILNDPTEGVKRFTPEEVEAARTAGYEAGKKDALAAAERDVAAALRQIGAAAEATLSRLNNETHAMREEAARIAMSAARKISGAALEAFGADRAAGAIEAVMDMLRHQPRLVVRLSPHAAETLRSRIEEMAATHAYAGAILVRAEPNMKAGQVSIDWSDGMITIDPDEAADRIQALIEQALVSAETAQD